MHEKEAQRTNLQERITEIQLSVERFNTGSLQSRISAGFAPKQERQKESTQSQPQYASTAAATTQSQP
ncbi:hypothetical protein PGTUg99_022594 [Puccinia graminis f. sp. tritici]|uniref:Uncharacterized protein n=1 Tax=Puccinia graminis f. sp. tritici TaxID=56615 RepID=A0A5B0P3G1_PUCGR|nr:hypothetical protein PGTUg99_022594 [Puccinia graminis f. sp. tritici]